MEDYEAEIEEGPTEYKYSLAHCNEERINKLISQMKWRLGEGNGVCYYLVGVEDDGSVTGISRDDLNKSIKVLEKMAESLDCKIVNVEEREGRKDNCFIGKVSISKKLVENIPLEARVIFLGETGSGKTTLLGVCKTDEADDGAGLARLHVLQHQHEIDRGKTSSVSIHVLRYGKDCHVILESQEQDNDADFFFGDDDPSKKHGQYSKIVSLIDVAGHPRFIKSTLFGLIACEPDLACVVVDARTLYNRFEPKPQILKDQVIPPVPPVMPSSCVSLPSFCFVDDEDEQEITTLGTTINHLELCKCLGIPASIILTQIDGLKEGITMEQLGPLVEKLLQKAEYKTSEIENIPVFSCSNTTLQGIGEIRHFLGETVPLKPIPLATDKQNVIMYIRKVFHVDNFEGTIVGGIVQSGKTINVTDHLLIGPDNDGKFHKVIVKSIRTSYGLSLSCVSERHTATLGIEFIEKDTHTFIRKGSCILSIKTEEENKLGNKSFKIQVNSWMTFSDGVLRLLDKPFQPDSEKRFEFVVRTHTIKQRALLKNIQNNHLEMEFLHRPEYLQDQDSIMLQNGSLLGVGNVVPI